MRPTQSRDGNNDSQRIRWAMSGGVSTHLLTQQDKSGVGISAGHQLDGAQLPEEGALPLQNKQQQQCHSVALRGGAPIYRVALLTLLSNRLRGLTLRLKVMAAFSSTASKKWCCTKGKWTPFCSSASSAMDAGPSALHHASSTDSSGGGASSTAESAWGERQGGVGGAELEKEEEEPGGNQ